MELAHREINSIAKERNLLRRQFDRIISKEVDKDEKIQQLQDKMDSFKDVEYAYRKTIQEKENSIHDLTYTE